MKRSVDVFRLLPNQMKLVKDPPRSMSLIFLCVLISVASGSLQLDSGAARRGGYGDPRPGHRKAGFEAPARIPKTGLWIADWWTFFLPFVLLPRLH